MERYYKASEIEKILIKLSKEPYYQHDGESFYAGVCAVEGELICLDTVEIEEPKIGEWLSFTRPKQKWVLTCSLCDEASNIKTKYCSNCGAKMVMEIEDE